ncbi:MAG: hypothetical protein KDK51_06195 [Deltaproteobacteria bacterium]|nr:hypothetical protein [Deltaproteobacteria bacterium]
MRRYQGLLFFLCFFSTKGWTYPTYIAKGYTQCASCHYNPNGGGLRNSYGFATQSATFPDDINNSFLASVREALQKNDVTGYNTEGDHKLQWDVGLDTRLALLNAESGSDDGDGGSNRAYAFFPMLVEVGGVMAYGPWMVYGSVTPRRAGSSKRPDTFFSREHWLGYNLGTQSKLRIGRMVMPFGIRQPDHTLYTREELGLNKWDQTYGLQWDYYNQHWMVSAMGFVGDLLLDPKAYQQRGGAISVSYSIASKASMGISMRASKSEYLRVIAGSLFSRATFLKRMYVMEEVALQQESSSENLGNTNTLATSFRTGIFPLESLDLYLEIAHRKVLDKNELEKTRYALGSQWQILPWVELIPVVYFEDTQPRNFITFLAQMHIVF